jgi:hypothetical protein
MLTTSATNAPTASVASDEAADNRRLGAFADIRPRLAGIGALGFVGIVVAQNIVRGGSSPAMDAPASEVLAHYADHRSLTAALVASFVVSATSLAVFLGGALRRLTAGARSAWAYTGYAAAVAVIALFAIVVGSEQALSVLAQGDDPNLGAVEALWALHNSIFTVNHLMVAVALLGLARAGVAAGITPRIFDRLAPVGAVLLGVSAMAGPFIAAGEAMPVFGIGLIGFVTWLAFLTATGVRLVRSRPVAGGES